MQPEDTLEYLIRTIRPSEAGQLEPLYRELARHHNDISTNFAGSFPSIPIESQLQECAADLSNGKSHVAVVEQRGEAIAFCKVDIVGTRGYLDELVVLPEYRGRGIGSQLMDWADEAFRERGVRHVELLVVVGNESARRFYERRGFLPSVLEMKRVEIVER